MADGRRSQRPPPPRAARLRVEALERRDNPADNFWMGYTTSFTDPANWSDGVPTPDDVLIFSGPTGGTGNPPLPPSGSNTSTTFVSLTPPVPYAPDTYAGIRIIEGYAGTLTIPFDIWFGGYEQSSGNTYTPGTNVTVNTTFLWTGGNLNTSTTAGEYRLQGVLLGIMDSDGETVSTGSTIRLQQNPVSGLASSVEVRNGEYDFAGGDGMFVQGGSLLLMAPVPKGLGKKLDGKIVYKKQPDSDGILWVDADSTAVLEPKDKRPTGNSTPAEVEFKGTRPTFMNSGTVVIKDYTDVRFTIDDPQNPNNQGMGMGYAQSVLGGGSPVTKIEAGCSILLEKKLKVNILDGTFELAERRGAGGVPVATQLPITITGEDANGVLWIQQNATLKRADANPLTPLILDITGTAATFLCDGTVELYAMRNVFQNDQITTNGQVEFGNNSVLCMKWFDHYGPLPYGDYWVLVKSIYTDPNGVQDAITGNPTFVYPPLNFPENLIPGLSSDKKKYQVLPLT